MAEPLKTPAKGSVDHVPLYRGTKYVDDEGEDIADIEEHKGPKHKVAIGVTDQEHFAGVAVGCVYLGPGALQRWQSMQLRFKIEETKRKAKVRKGFNKETATEFWDADFLTEEGQAAFHKMCGDIFAEGVSDVQGIEGGEDKETALEFIDGFGEAEKLRLLNQCKKLQGLQRHQVFAEGPGGMEPE